MNKLFQALLLYGFGSQIVRQRKLSHKLWDNFPPSYRPVAEFYSDTKFVQALLAQLTWWHNLLLLEKNKAYSRVAQPARQMADGYPYKLGTRNRTETIDEKK